MSAHVRERSLEEVAVSLYDFPPELHRVLVRDFLAHAPAVIAAGRLTEVSPSGTERDPTAGAAAITPPTTNSSPRQLGSFGIAATIVATPGGVAPAWPPSCTPPNSRCCSSSSSAQSRPQLGQRTRLPAPAVDDRQTRAPHHCRPRTRPIDTEPQVMDGGHSVPDSSTPA